jgi:16S rRNA (adenine(1408)-N(1))-methyltransferase
VIVDLGAGDGRAVLARAQAESGALVIGIDANASAMSEASRRADRGRNRRLANACFLVAAAEALPGPLAGAAQLVTVTLPWGSLLRGVLGLDPWVLRGIASIVAPGGSVEVLATVVPTDHVDGVDVLDREPGALIAAAWLAVGCELISMAPATRKAVLASRSSWARRLGDRPVWHLEFRRCGRSPEPSSVTTVVPLDRNHRRIDSQRRSSR